MTQDTNITLTEDDFKIHKREKGFNQYALHFEGTIEDCIKAKQEILKTLDQYPKLVQINQQYKDLIIICDTLTEYGTKLKEENERLTELNSIWFNSTTENGEIIKKLVQENNQLKQVCKLYIRTKQEEIAKISVEMINKSYQESQTAVAKMEIIKNEIEKLQQLLKGDSTS